MFEKKRACVYTRVSTTEQANEGYSLEEQDRKCQAAIVSKGWEYIGTYSDPGVTGRSMNRPGLQQMLADIRDGKAAADIEDVFIPFKIVTAENVDEYLPAE